MESQEPISEEAEEGHVSVSELTEAEIAPSGEEGMALRTCCSYCFFSEDIIYELKCFTVCLKLTCMSLLV